jgi:hypothetical protein
MFIRKHLVAGSALLATVGAAVSARAEDSSTPLNDEISHDTLYGYTHNLPICEWGSTADASLAAFVLPMGEFTCAESLSSSDDSCTFTPLKGPLPVRPDESRYVVRPRMGVNDMVWSDGSELRSPTRMQCERMRRDADSPSRDVVTQNIVRGVEAPGRTCGTRESAAVILANVSGGTVEHIRPGLVRGRVDVRLFLMAVRPDDLALAIQVYDGSEWVDYATEIATTQKTLGTFEVEAFVPESTDVRLQVRGCTEGASRVPEYDLRRAEIFVEQCIPDQSDPGHCLGD